VVLDNDITRIQPRNILAAVIVGSASESFTASRSEKGNTYVLSFPASELGTHLVAVYSDERQLPNSPFLFKVTLPNCNATPGRVADLSGECVCPYHSTVDIAGACVSYVIIIPSVVLPVLLLCSAAAAAYVLKRNAEEEAMWRIKSGDLVWSCPPEVLGCGTEGSVYKATFRGTPVAVKRFAEVDRGLGQQSLHNDLVISDHAFSRQSTGDSSVSSAETRGRRSSSLSIALFSAQLKNIISTNVSSVKFEARKTVKFLVGVRHPYITTVMGGLLLNGKELCLVLELMDLGSLFDCLHNILFPMDGELALNFLQCIAKGMTFLHSASTPIIHGDLKSGEHYISHKH
jgi:hypothetical protein